MDSEKSHKKILIIDDEPIIRQVFTYYLEDQDFEVLCADNGRIGMVMVERENPDLVLTDLRMPEADGLEVLDFVRNRDPEVPVIVISGANRLDDAIEALRLGAWDYLIKPVQDLSMLQHTIDKSLEKSALLKENRAYREHLEELVFDRTRELGHRNRQLDMSRKQIIGILAQAAEYRDFETGDHFLRVSGFSACIARNLGWNEEDIQTIQLASPVHDIGKIGIPDGILLKHSKLTPEEWEIMKKHCEYGKGILTSNRYVNVFTRSNQNRYLEEGLDFDQKLIETAANIAYCHHEHWDGTGYPRGLKGAEIPREARVTAVADVYDALCSQRPYKEPWPEEKCLEFLKEKAGSYFDPEVVNSFISNLETIREIQEAFKG